MHFWPWQNVWLWSCHGMDDLLWCIMTKSNSKIRMQLSYQSDATEIVWHFAVVMGRQQFRVETIIIVRLLFQAQNLSLVMHYKHNEAQMCIFLLIDYCWEVYFLLKILNSIDWICASAWIQSMEYEFLVKIHFSTIVT